MAKTKLVFSTDWLISVRRYRVQVAGRGCAVPSAGKLSCGR